MRGFIFICLFFAGELRAQFLWQFYRDTVITWNYYFGEEFNRTAIDEQKWFIGFPWGKNIISQETFVTDSNLILDQQTARFTLKKDERLRPLESWQVNPTDLKKDKVTLNEKNEMLFKYTGALLWSKQTFRYGYFEAKFRAPEGKGIWPAFWLYAGQQNYEIDFFELKGEYPHRLHVDVHCPSGCSDYKKFLRYRKAWGHWVNTAQDLRSDFNIVSGEWTPGYIRWYLNGELIAYFAGSFDMPMNLSVGTGIAKDNGPFKPGPDKKTPFPNTFEVDYVRVYQSDSLPHTGNLRANFRAGSVTAPADSSLMFSARRKGRIQNRPKAYTEEPLITISATPLSASSLLVRALGVGPSDRVSLKLLDADGRVLGQQEFRYSFEKEIPIPGSGQDLYLTVEVNGKIIREKLHVD
jgi:beta-glucanase (GH16 family)